MNIRPNIRCIFTKRGSYGNIVTGLHFFPQYPAVYDASRKI